MDWLGRLGAATRVAALSVAAVAMLAYANSVPNGFAYDDHLIIAGNEGIHDLRKLPQAFWKPYWPNSHGRELGLWRPATTLVYGLQWVLWRGEARGFHAVNVLLHCIVSALVTLLLARLMPVGVALTAGLLFAVHPVHAEAVANVVGMAELLSAALYLGACLLVVDNPGGMSRWLFLAILGLFAVAALSKESAITLPGAVLLLDSARSNLRVADWRRYLARRGALYLGLVVVIGLVCAGRMLVLGAVAAPFPPLGAELLATGAVPRIWTVLGTWPVVFRLLFMPLDLSVDYAPGVIRLAYWWTPEAVLGLAMGLSALTAAWIAWRRGPMNTRALAVRSLGFGVVWFVITALPTSNLLFLTGVLVAERTLYLPSVGLCAAAGWMLASLRSERRRTGAVLVVLAITAGMIRTMARNPVWRDNGTVFTTLIVEHPESGRAQWLLGDMHLARKDPDQALGAYRRAIGLLGGDYALLSDVGRRLNAAGYEQAGEHVLRRAWQAYPRFATAPATLAILYDRQERWGLAEEASRAALRADSTNVILAHLLARSLGAQGRHREALEARRLARITNKSKHETEGTK